MNCLAAQVIRSGLLRSTTTATKSSASALVSSRSSARVLSSSSRSTSGVAPSKTTRRERRTYVTEASRSDSNHPKVIVGDDKFECLFAALKPGMKEDELAMVIAGLFLSAGNKAKLSRLEEAIPSFIKEFDHAKLYKKVNYYMANPPADNFESLTGKELSKNGKSKSVEQPPPSPTPVDKSQLEGKTRLDQLMVYLDTPSAQVVLQNLDSEAQSVFTFLMSQVIDSSGRENMGVLNTIAKFMSTRGLDVQYVRSNLDGNDRVLPLGSDVDSTSMDPVELAKRAAVDESLNPIDTPTLETGNPYPNLMTPDPLLDARDVAVFPPTPTSPYTNRVITRNHTSIFHAALLEQSPPGTDPFADPSSTWEPETTDETSEDLESLENLPLPPTKVRNLYRFPLIARRVTQQTGKGKIHRVQYLVVVGNGDGLVGYGQAKDEDAPRALAKATALAIRSMDTVARFEKRTVPTEMETKLGSTRIIMRPRPVGFGLRCNPNLHQVLKAAGIKDVSAKVWGSRNPVNVVKAAFRMLWAGHAPHGMGDGVGGKGKKLDKGEGIRSVYDVERERGRKLVSLRK
ncbi:hypothetical protein AX17_002958 [Amanita inopinata Kibby_2008]|nr:hypothetical protein AX17_002958 [Amanita inopinata Kibby_2008]